MHITTSHFGSFKNAMRRYAVLTASAAALVMGTGAVQAKAFPGNANAMTQPQNAANASLFGNKNFGSQSEKNVLVNMESGKPISVPNPTGTLEERVKNAQAIAKKNRPGIKPQITVSETEAKKSGPTNLDGVVVKGYIPYVQSAKGAVFSQAAGPMRVASGGIVDATFRDVTMEGGAIGAGLHARSGSNNVKLVNMHANTALRGQFDAMTNVQTGRGHHDVTVNGVVGGLGGTGIAKIDGDAREANISDGLKGYVSFASQLKTEYTPGLLTAETVKGYTPTPMILEKKPAPTPIHAALKEHDMGHAVPNMSVRARNREKEIQFPVPAMAA